MKLIDPRGNLGSQGPWGPIEYDLAKLSHSVCGSYELITNNLLDWSFKNSLQPRLSFAISNQKLVPVFSDWLEKKGQSLARVRLFETSLFLSMLPLHMDNPPALLAHFHQSLSAFQDAQKKGLK